MEAGVELQPVENALAMARASFRTASQKTLRAAAQDRQGLKSKAALQKSAWHLGAGGSSSSSVVVNVGADIVAALTRNRRDTNYGSFTCSSSCNEGCVSLK